MDEESKFKTPNCQTTRREYMGNTSKHSYGQWFLIGPQKYRNQKLATGLTSN
jgi:hypothetical protein